MLHTHQKPGIHSSRHVRRLMKELHVNSRRTESDLGVIESAIKVRLCVVLMYVKRVIIKLEILYLT